MNDGSTTAERKGFRLRPDELAQSVRDGYIVRQNVFMAEENDMLCQVAEDIVDGKRPFPSEHIAQNSLVRNGEVERSGIYAMHKIHHPSCYCQEFLVRMRDLRLTSSLINLLGPDILGINNLFIWKASEIGLGFPGIRTSTTSAVGSGQRRQSAHGPP